MISSNKYEKKDKKKYINTLKTNTVEQALYDFKLY